MVVPAYSGCNNSVNKVQPTFRTFLGLENSSWDFFFFGGGGLIFGPQIFGGFVQSPTDFFGF